MHGCQAFLQDVNQQIDQARAQGMNSRAFILHVGERYAYIRLTDLYRPWQFLRQISSAPPVCFGADGFRHQLVDDHEPARHYTAFVFVGYWLPTAFATLILWGWEILGFIRYGGHWSQPDIRCGTVGIRHGRAIRKTGPTIWPQLIERELRERAQ